MQKLKYTGIVLLSAFIAALIGWILSVDSQDSKVEIWEKAGIECLNNGHSNVLNHIHAHFTIKENGEEKAIPANIGVVGSCMAEVHTHEPNGQIHIETIDTDKKFTLAWRLLFGLGGKFTALL